MTADLVDLEVYMEKVINNNDEQIPLTLAFSSYQLPEFSSKGDSLSINKMLLKFLSFHPLTTIPFNRPFFLKNPIPPKSLEIILHNELTTYVDFEWKKWMEDLPHDTVQTVGYFIIIELCQHLNADRRFIRQSLSTFQTLMTIQRLWIRFHELKALEAEMKASDPHPQPSVTLPPPVSSNLSPQNSVPQLSPQTASPFSSGTSPATTTAPGITPVTPQASTSIPPALSTSQSTQLTGQPSPSSLPRAPSRTQTTFNFDSFPAASSSAASSSSSSSSTGSFPPPAATASHHSTSSTSSSSSSRSQHIPFVSAEAQFIAETEVTNFPQLCAQQDYLSLWYPPPFSISLIAVTALLLSLREDTHPRTFIEYRKAVKSAGLVDMLYFPAGAIVSAQHFFAMFIRPRHPYATLVGKVEREMRRIARHLRLNEMEETFATLFAHSLLLHSNFMKRGWQSTIAASITGGLHFLERKILNHNRQQDLLHERYTQNDDLFQKEKFEHKQRLKQERAARLQHKRQQQQASEGLAPTQGTTISSSVDRQPTLITDLSNTTGVSSSMSPQRLSRLISSSSISTSVSAPPVDSGPSSVTVISDDESSSSSLEIPYDDLVTFNVEYASLKELVRIELERTRRVAAKKQRQLAKTLSQEHGTDDGDEEEEDEEGTPLFRRGSQRLFLFHPYPYIFLLLFLQVFLPSNVDDSFNLPFPISFHPLLLLLSQIHMLLLHYTQYPSYLSRQSPQNNLTIPQMPILPHLKMFLLPLHTQVSDVPFQLLPLS